MRLIEQYPDDVGDAVRLKAIASQIRSSGRIENYFWPLLTTGVANENTKRILVA
ncbi:MAG: hypothetical protein M0Q22_16270 [Sulfuritalea sp.]|jgi:hypothetical protein|nr:hypothetical protein [Sulfuritalea sp.]